MMGIDETVFCQLKQVIAIPALAQLPAQSAQLVIADEPLAPCNFLGRTDLQTLPRFDSAHEVGGVVERIEGSGIKPRSSAGQHRDVEVALFEVQAVDVGDLKLSTGRR